MEEKIWRREELVGKDVYDSSAYKVGKVSDVGFSKDGEIILIISDGKIENKVPFLSSGIGDIILLKPEVKLKREEVEPEQKIFPELEKICPQCGQKNKPKAKFCIRCRHDFYTRASYQPGKKFIIEEFKRQLHGADFEENVEVKGKYFIHTIDLVATFSNDPRGLSLGSVGMIIFEDSDENRIFEFIGRIYDMHGGYFNPLILIITEDGVKREKYSEFEEFMEEKHANFNLDFWTFFVTKNNFLDDIKEIVSACETLEEGAHHVESLPSR